MTYPGKWIITDPDAKQRGRQLGPTRFEFEEDYRYSSVIELSDYTMKAIYDVLAVYGYKSLADIEKNYGGNPSVEWIIAECLFEQEF